MNKPKYIPLPQFLTNPAATPFRAVHVVARYRAVTCCLKAVQHLHQTHAMLDAIRDARASVQTIHQLATKTEIEFSAPLEKLVYRCGDLQVEIQKITYFINDLHPSIQFIAARYRESQPRRTLAYNQLVQYIRDEGAFRVQFRVTRSNRNSTGARNKDTGVSHLTKPILNEGLGLLLLPQSDSLTQSISTDDLRSTED